MFRVAFAATARFIFFLVKELPEDDKLAFRALLHSTAKLLHLIECQPMRRSERRCAEQKLIDVAIWFLTALLHKSE